MKRTILFSILLSVNATSQAFTMTNEHCELLKEETATTVMYKEINETRYNRHRALVQTYEVSSEKELFLDMWPYVTAVIDEYYDNDMLTEIDYADAIDRGCLDKVGQEAK